MTATQNAVDTKITTAEAGGVRLSGVSKRYPGGTLALDGVDLTVKPGEFVCLVGASGCGKSTLLNLVAGLDKASAGSIEVDGGRAAFMFQEPALFPWLKVGQNVEAPLKLRGIGRKERGEQAAELLRTVRLQDVADKRPHELSGGMRQRVAMARTLAQEASVLLMDEPFAALDAMTRDALHDEIERIWLERNLTVLFVTHNVREAARLADRIVLLASRPGRVIEEFEVEEPRPRRLESGRTAQLAGRVTERLKEEVRRHVS
jgi:NitT/TauT family transport system ATP-binding protein